MDAFNNCFYLKDETSANKLHKFIIDNTISNKYECVEMSEQIAMNLVANNIDYKYVKGDEKETKGEGKTRGLLYHDFCCADNLLVVLHGRAVSVFDLMEKEKDLGHFMLPFADPEKPFADPYDLSSEPQIVWMMDKDVRDTEQRYKIVIAFKNGEVKELANKEDGSGMELKDYLQDDRQKSVKLPGEIVKVFRDRNSIQQPVYFLLKNKETEEVTLSTIEFHSQTLR